MVPRKTPTFADRHANRKTSHALTSAQVWEEKHTEEEHEALCLATLSREQLREQNAWLEVPNSFDDNGTTVGGYKDDVLHRCIAAEISHAGETVQEDAAAADLQTLLEKLCACHNLLFAKCCDTWNHNNRTQLLVGVFAAQMEKLTDAYMAWSLASTEEGLGKLYTHPEDTVVEEHTCIYVVDLFSAYYADVPLVQGEHYVVSVYMGQGLMPTASYSPNVTITIGTLEIFQVMQLCCPHLSMQVFVRVPCDIHGVALCLYLGAQFSIAFNIYLAICAKVDKHTQVVLGRDALNWHLKNACLCCLYKLEGKVVLCIPLLITFDGNNSLKRFWWREREWVDDSGVAVPGASKEHHNARRRAM